MVNGFAIHSTKQEDRARKMASKGVREIERKRKKRILPFLH